jgi:hypothetical protein
LTKPRAAAVADPGIGWKVYASWNGATTVSRWQLRAGTSPGSLHPVATADWGGFETAITLTSSSDRYAAMRAISASGATLGTSPTITLP